MPSRRALLVAPIYDGTFLPPLAGAHAVMERLDRCLTQWGGYQVERLQGEVSRKRIRAKFRQFTDTEGEIFFFFYGHGVLRDKMGVLATSDAEDGDEGVLMLEILRGANDSQAREAILIFDCCHSGAVVPATAMEFEAITGQLKSGRAVLAACASHQQSWVAKDQAEKQLGIFSSYVLRGLEGEARNLRTNAVRAISLGEYITTAFHEWGQNPFCRATDTGDLLCVVTSGLPSNEQSAPRSSSAANAESALILGLPFKPSELFVGRSAEIDRLCDTLVDRKRPIAISATVEGLGGIGKTELVIQLLHRPEIQLEFKTIIWLDGAGPIPPQWQKVASILKIAAPESDPLVLIQAIGLELRRRGTTLIVLDNASDWNSVSHFIPSGTPLLVTTRTRNFGGAAFQHLELGVLSEGAATDFLVALAPHLRGDLHLQRLVDSLQGHTLALELAGGTIESLGLGAGDYLTRLACDLPVPQSVLTTIKYGKTLDACLALTWDSLRRDSSRVLWRRAALFAPTSAHRDLLRVSFYGDEDTRREILYLQENRRDYFQQLGNDALLRFEATEFDEAYSELRGANVLSRVEGFNGERWSMHRLVRDFGRARMQAGELMMHAMALSEWLRRPTLELNPEIPHFVAAILDTAKFAGPFAGIRGARYLSKELTYRSRIILDSEYFLDYIRGELRDPRALTMILDGLTDINEDVRVESIRLLESVGHIPEVLEGLATALDDPDVKVRTLAGKALSQHGGPRIVAILRETLASQRPRARHEAVLVLALLGDRAQDALHDALGNPDPVVRTEAALLLSQKGNPTSFDVLAQAIRDLHGSELRQRAIRALEGARHPGAQQLLLDLLGDPDELSATAAIEAFQAKSDPSLADVALQRLLQRPGLNEALSSAGLLNGVLGLASAYGLYLPYEFVAAALLHESAEVRRNAAITMRRIRDSRATSSLLQALGAAEGDVRMEVLRTLGILGGSECVEHLRTHLTSEQISSNRQVAAEALVRLASRDEILEVFRTAPLDVRSSLLDACKNSTNIGSAVAIINLAFMDSEAWLRGKAVEIASLSQEAAALINSMSQVAAQDTDTSVRQKAAAALVRQRCLMGRSDPGYLCTSADLVAQLNAVPAGAVLEYLSRNQTPEVCDGITTLIYKFVALGSSKVQPRQLNLDDLRTRLHTSDVETRRYAVICIAKMGRYGVPALQDIVPLLEDADAAVRMEAVRALAKIGNRDFLPRLAEVSETDADTEVRKTAILAVARLSPE